MTVLRKSRELKANTARRGPYTTLSKIWIFILYSLLLDPLLTSIVNHPVPEATSARLAALCALLTLPFLRPEIARRYLSALRNANRSDTSRLSKIAKPMVFACLIAPALSKLLFVPRLDNLLAIVFLGMLAFGAFTNARKSLKDRAIQNKLLQESPAHRIKQWERHSITVTTISFVAARTISLCGVFCESSRNAPLTALGYTAMSALFLMMLRPQKQFFMGVCKRCKRPVPSAFVDYGSCPLCDETLL